MFANRIAGILLVSFAIVGYFTVADDLRHSGELIGVSSFLLAGCTLLVNGYHLLPLSNRLSRILAGGILFGILLGAALDQMFIGLGLGLFIGSLIGAAITKLKKYNASNSP